jgi:hypothetical protein
MDAQGKRIDKITKLLTLAQDPGATRQEAEAFARHAAKIMAKNGITEDMINAASGTQQGIVQKILTLQCPHPTEMSLLIGSIVETLHCKALYIAALPGRHNRKVIVIGTPHDVDHAIRISQVILVQALRGLESQSPPPWGGDPGRDHFRKNYLRAYGVGVCGRLEMIKKETRREYERDNPATGAPGVDIVLAGKREKLHGFLHATYPDLKSEFHEVTDFYGGVNEGYRSAMEADIGLSAMKG